MPIFDKIIKKLTKGLSPRNLLILVVLLVVAVVMKFTLWPAPPGPEAFPSPEFKRSDEESHNQMHAPLIEAIKNNPDIPPEHKKLIIQGLREGALPNKGHPPAKK